MTDEKTKGAAPDQENAPSKQLKQQNTKELSILQELRTGRSLNRFEAERLGDHCLHSTISTLRNKGYLFYDEWERVPTRFNREIRVKRYHYVGWDVANRRYQKRPIEAIDGMYGAIPHVVMDSAAFRGAPYPAKSLLFELMRQHSGANNGHLHLSFSWLHSRGWTSRDVIQRAKGNLIERHLIIQTRQGGLNIDASRFAVTWLDISNFVGLDIAAKDYHKGAWAFLDTLPTGKKIRCSVPPNGKGSTGRRYSPIPPAGIAQAATVP